MQSSCLCWFGGAKYTFGERARKRLRHGGLEAGNGTFTNTMCSIVSCIHMRSGKRHKGKASVDVGVLANPTTTLLCAAGAGCRVQGAVSMPKGVRQGR